MKNKTPRATFDVTIPNPGYDPTKPRVAWVWLHFASEVPLEERAQQIVAVNKHQNPNPDAFDAKVKEVRKWAKKQKIACHFAGMRWSDGATVIVRWWDAGAAALFKLTYGGAQ